MGCQMMVGELVSSLGYTGCNMLAMAQYVIDNSSQIIRRMLKTKDFLIVFEIIRDEQRESGGDMDSIAGSMFPETKRVKSGASKRKHDLALL